MHPDKPSTVSIHSPLKFHLPSLRPSWNCVILALAAVNSVHAADPWTPLFNGRDLAGWTMFMARPDRTWDVPGLKRDATGNYLEPIGKNRDPLKVFVIEIVDGRPAIHVSGQGFSVITTAAMFVDFHLRLQVKWGDRRWGAKLNAARGRSYDRRHESPVLRGFRRRQIGGGAGAA